MSSLAAADERPAEADLARELFEARDDARRLSERADLLEPMIDLLLELRSEARRAGDYARGDAIRQRLNELGVEVTDSADGTADYRLPSD